MATQATARVTLGSIFGTVNSVATSVSSVFDTATKGINMANKFVSDAADNQRIRSTVDRHNFITKLAEEKSMEETLRKKTIIEFTSQSKENEELFASAYNNIMNLLADEIPSAQKPVHEPA